MMPFPGGVEGIENGTLVLSVAAAVLYLFAVARPVSWRRSLVKTASVALLALLVVISSGPKLLIGALILSALGDACLAQEREKWFLAGLAAFFAAHVAYIALFFLAGGGLGLLLAEPWRLLAAVLVALAVVAILIRLRSGLPAALRLPVPAYAAAIVAMVATSLTLDRPLVIAGAMLFAASDGILAFDRFPPGRRNAGRSWAPPTVWMVYYAAQFLITVGALLPA
jgi:uncharacterized membrane protein YhhN